MAGAGPPLTLRVFLASPGDVAEERAFVRDYLDAILPNDPLLQGRAGFKVVSWDHPHAGTPMPAHLTPQEAVIRFKDRPSDCDIVIVILAARLGTHLALDTFRNTGQVALARRALAAAQSRLGRSEENPDAIQLAPR